MSIPHTDKSTYAADRAAQHETPFATWRRTIIRKTPDEIAQLFVDMEQRHIGDLGLVGKALADAETEIRERGALFHMADSNYQSLVAACEVEQQRAQEIREDYEYALQVIAELNQGCADLAQRAQTAEELLFTVFSLSTCDAYLLENALKRLNAEQHSHDTTKRLLVGLQAEADDLRDRLAKSAETHVNDLAWMGGCYDALSVAHTEAIDVLGRVAHCLIEHIDIGPSLTQLIMTTITPAKDTTP